MARVFEMARGIKSLPSWSTSVKMGKKETAMTKSEKNTEGPTCFKA